MRRVDSLLLTTLLVLSLVVIVYNYIFFANLPRLWCVQVESRLFPPENEPPVVDITNHLLRDRIMDYINTSMQSINWKNYGFGERVYIVNDPEIHDFFSQYYVSTWCGTCAWNQSPYLKNGDEYYHIMVGYTSLSLSALEDFFVLSTVLVPIILWIFALTVFPTKEAESI